MDIVNNQYDFKAALHLLCELNYARCRHDVGYCSLHCPLTIDGCCNVFFNFNDYSLDRREELADLYSSIGLPEYADEAFQLAKAINRACTVLAQREDTHTTPEKNVKNKDNDAESHINAEETEVIRITRDKHYRPVLYVNGECVCYGNSFMIDGNIDGTLSYDVMGVPI